jgi:hypothetical protein
MFITLICVLIYASKSVSSQHYFVPKISTISQPLGNPNLCKQNSIVATLFRSKFFCVILLLHSAHAYRLILPVK